MGIFNQQPNYKQSFTKGMGGATGAHGAGGASGTGFSHTADGNYDMVNKKLTNMAKGTDSSDAITKNQLDSKLSLCSGLMTGSLDMNNNRIYDLAQPNGDNQPATKICSENKFLDKSSGVMAGPLNMSNNKITHLANPTNNTDGANKKYIDDNYLKLPGGIVIGHIILSNTVRTSQYQAISGNTGNAYFVQIINPYVYT